jgi:hypothetical protein
MMSVTQIIQHAHANSSWGGLPPIDTNLGMSSVGPNSPLDMKPDTASLIPNSSFSPTGGGGGNHSPSLPQSSFTITSNFNVGSGGSGSGGGPKSPGPSGYPPNHPLCGSKHLCSICGDRASGKHYGVYSCEGCKGFFKRTVRKDLTYACREERKCIIDKRQRNRCQYCRYQKCLHMGMKREAVQEERQRTKEKNDSEVESTSSIQQDMPLDKILEAELRMDSAEQEYADHNRTPQTKDLQNTSLIRPIKDQFVQSDSISTNFGIVADKQLLQLVEWAKHIPHFSELPTDDQVRLLHAGWNELLIAAFSYRSIEVKDSIILATGITVHKSHAHSAGVGSIFDRVLTELVEKMRDMKMDRTEIGCLRSIVLYNPEVKQLSCPEHIEVLRERVYAALEEYCKQTYHDEPGRFAKLLLRLPSLRSIGLKCLEHLFFFKLIVDTPIETFLTKMLANDNNSVINSS